MIDAASTSFVGAMTSGMYVGAGFVVASFVIAAVMVPWRMQRQEVVAEQAARVIPVDAASTEPARVEAAEERASQVQSVPPASTGS